MVTELDGQLSGAFTAVIPLGGGGLLAGSVLAAGRTRHPVTLFGVESANSRAVSTAVAAGAITPVEVSDTLADGLAGNIEPGAITPDIIAGRADLVSVSEESIVDAIRYLQAKAGLVVEGSGAVGLAALGPDWLPARDGRAAAHRPQHRPGPVRPADRRSGLTVRVRIRRRGRRPGTSVHCRPAR